MEFNTSRAGKRDVYGTDVYAYLGRARRQLDNHEPASLFYAALEIRCGIESRLQEYLDARQDIAKHKKQGWKLAESERELAKIFRDQRTIVEIEIKAPGIEGEIRLFHTPVTRELRNAGERLDDLRHCLKVFRESRDPWWDEIRNSLENTFRQLEIASSGTLRAPPVWAPDGRILHINAFYHKTNPISPLITSVAASLKGKKHQLKIAYHSTLPPYAEKFLNHWQSDP